MRILEQFVRGKHPDDGLCEDVVVATDQLVAVVDGATDKAGLRFPTSDGASTGGRFAALLLAEELSTLEPGTPPRDAVAALSRALDAAIVAQAGQLPAYARPSASVVVYDHVLGRVWRVGDCSFRLDTSAHLGGKTIDRVTADFRAAYLATLDEAAPADGTDPGREVILPLLRRQADLANRPGEFGYGVLNGMPVPAEFIEQVVVDPSVRDLVLASDGYPTLPGTLKDAEDNLRAALEADPQCVAELRSTKGLMAGLRSFDDRAWVRVSL